ncbi:hypothetical protein M501DRAFT_915906, partial [Patellaria atrata CBS 101060]
YFTYIPHPSTHFSIETPLPSPADSSGELPSPDPYNPLLAYRELPTPLDMTANSQASKVLQLQTTAAYTQMPRKAQAIQDVFDLEDDGSEDATETYSRSSSTSSTANSTPVPPTFVRCLRCRRDFSTGSAVSTGSHKVQFGVNLYYCGRCASLVG